jgi:hypothetical protein
MMHSIRQLSQALLIAPKTGGTITVYLPDEETGEMVAFGEIGLAPGCTRGRVLPLGEYFPPDTAFDLGEDVGIVFRNTLRAVPMKPAGRHESGANPDFVPSRMTEAEARLTRMVQGLQANVQGLQRRVAAAQAKAHPVLVEQDDEEESKPPTPLDDVRQERVKAPTEEQHFDEPEDG